MVTSPHSPSPSENRVLPPLVVAKSGVELGLLPGMANRSWMLHDADLDPLRGHPRFARILEQVPSH